MAKYDFPKLSVNSQDFIPQLWNLFLERLKSTTDQRDLRSAKRLRILFIYENEESPVYSRDRIFNGIETLLHKWHEP